MSFEVDILFKEEYTQMMAQFVNRFGQQHLVLIEDSIQDAFYKALKIWPLDPPGNPKGWIRTVTRNGIIDRLRKNKNATRELSFLLSKLAADDVGPAWEEEIKDNQLKMIFACCHPAIKASDQLLLSLKFLCGFGNRQIAKALLKSPAAIEKAISRAKVKFKNSLSNFEIPKVEHLRNRLDGVLRIIYLQFTEGYKVTEGENLVNKSICIDSIKLALLIASYPEFLSPKLNALLALMYFQASRLDGRVDENQKLLTLEHQDRSKWNYKYVMQGSLYLSRSATGNKLDPYHIEAAAASFHAISPRYEQTNWQAIFNLYDLATQHYSNPHYQLNRLIALHKSQGAETTVSELAKVEDLLPENHLTYVFLGDLLLELKQTEEAQYCYQKALKKTNNKLELDFIQTKISKNRP